MINREAWCAAAHGGHKESDMTKQLNWTDPLEIFIFSMGRLWIFLNKQWCENVGQIIVCSFKRNPMWKRVETNDQSQFCSQKWITAQKRVHCSVLFLAWLLPVGKQVAKSVHPYFTGCYKDNRLCLSCVKHSSNRAVWWLSEVSLWLLWSTISRTTLLVGFWSGCSVKATPWWELEDRGK